MTATVQLPDFIHISNHYREEKTTKKNPNNISAYVATSFGQIGKN